MRTAALFSARHASLERGDLLVDTLTLYVCMQMLIDPQNDTS